MTNVIIIDCIKHMTPIIFPGSGILTSQPRPPGVSRAPELQRDRALTLGAIRKTGRGKYFIK